MVTQEPIVIMRQFLKDFGFSVEKENEAFVQTLKPEIELEMEAFQEEYQKEVNLTTSQKEFLSNHFKKLNKK